MKKILLVDSSPRKDGNSDVIVSLLAKQLKDAEVTTFKMCEHKCNSCLACGWCQGKDTVAGCVQKDDFTTIIPLLDTCDGIVMATPIYNHQINSQAKLFIERFYPFFNFAKKNMSNTTKYGKKAALICSCWGGPLDIYQKYAAWTVENFKQMGAEELKSLVFNQIPGRGDIKQHSEYLEQVRKIGQWLLAE